MAGLSWFDALGYCEEQVICADNLNLDSRMIFIHLQDGFLAEPKTEEQLNFLASLAYVEEMATGVQGWWVGLADLGHEGEWVWQVIFCIFKNTILHNVFAVCTMWVWQVIVCTVCYILEALRCSGKSPLLRLTGRTPTSATGTPAAPTCRSTTRETVRLSSRSPSTRR